MWRAGAGTVCGSGALLLSSRLVGAAYMAVEEWVESASTE